jgi:hypothetical protein
VARSLADALLKVAEWWLEAGRTAAVSSGKAEVVMFMPEKMATSIRGPITVGSSTKMADGIR